MHKIIRNAVAAAALIAVGACGFHLRSDAWLPSALQPIYLGGDAQSGFGQALRYQLTNSETDVTPYKAEANYQLIIAAPRHQQRIISLDRRGLAAEYGLTTSVEFELHDKAGKRVFGPQTVEERRTVTNNPDNPLTTSQDITLIRTDMNQALATKVVRRLAAFAKNPQAAQQKAGTPTGEQPAQPAQ